MATKKNTRALSSRASGKDPKAAQKRTPPLTQALAAPIEPPSETEAVEKTETLKGDKPVMKTAAAKRRERAADRDVRSRQRRGLPPRTSIKPRHYDHSANWLKLKNKDENRKYVFAAQSSHDTGVDHYAELGYRVEQVSKHGVSLGKSRVQRAPGAEIEMRGMTLMSIEREEYEEIVEFGEDGQTGQAQADIMERKIHVGHGSNAGALHGQVVEGARVAEYDAELEA